MAGILQFTLGLEMSSFLRGLGLASGGILSLAIVGQGLQTAMRGVWSAIESGAALKDMSARTGESVENLFKLRHALDIVGVGADAAAPMVLKLQKSMSGVTEDGEKTSALFAAIGLDFNRLKQMDVTERIIALGTALDGINNDQAAGIAGKIFGREGAGNIVQIARSMDDFKQSLTDASPAARVFQQTADLFDRIDDTITTIKMKVGGMFAGIAEGIGPALQKLLDFAKGLDFVGFGQRIGDELEMVVNSFSAGKFAEYFTLAIQAGLQEGINFLATTDWGKVIDSIKKAAFGQGDAQAWAEKFVHETAQKFVRGKLNFADDWNMNPFLDKLKKLRGELAGSQTDTGTVSFINWVTGLAGQFKRTVDLPEKEEKEKFVTPNVSAWEKIGLVFNNGTSRTDHQRDIASNTRRTYEILKQIAERGSGSTPTFANQ